jgi:hypothetical protein
MKGRLCSIKMILATLNNRTNRQKGLKKDNKMKFKKHGKIKKRETRKEQKEINIYFGNVDSCIFLSECVMNRCMKKQNDFFYNNEEVIF